MRLNGLLFNEFMILADVGHCLFRKLIRSAISRQRFLHAGEIISLRLVQLGGVVPTSGTILFFVLSALGPEEADMYYFVCRTRQFR